MWFNTFVLGLSMSVHVIFPFAQMGYTYRVDPDFEACGQFLSWLVTVKESRLRPRGSLPARP